MASVRFGVYLALLAISGVSTFAQRQPIGGVQEYTGTISYTTSGKHSTTVGVITETFTVEQSAQLQAHVTWNPNLRRYDGYVTEGAAMIKETLVFTSPDSRSERGTSGESKDMSKSPNGGRRKFAIDLQSDGQYQPNLLDNDIQARFYSQGAFDKTQPMRLFLYAPGHFMDLWRQPLEGNVLKGSGKVKHGTPHPVSEEPDIYIHVEWEFRPGLAAPAEDEVVVTSSTYDQFRPEAGIGGGRGNDITFTARLQKAGGGEPSEKAVKFEWKFKDVSREPGYTMNMPVLDPDAGADLRFEARDELRLTDHEGLMAETPVGERVESTAVIGSHDWGGFGAIEVTAVLQSGKRRQGVLQGGGAEILVPKRTPGDQIAESWRIAKGVAGIDASADYENAPIGDGNAGDGLTLYEEYRGFIENGLHIEGDPRKKDFMIFNDAGSGYLAGIRRFAQLSELATHWKFQRNEWQESNVVNLNFARGPHLVAQHGARVQGSAAHAGYAEAKGHTVYIAPLDGTEDQQMFDYMNSSLVHELMHTVNVYHHGDKVEPLVRWTNLGDSEDVLEVRLNKNGDSIGEAKPIRVLRETGERVPGRLPEGGLVVRIGMPHGQHSGDDKCVMRYDSAGAYVSVSDPDVRYRATNEPTGTMLCRSPLGKGVNEMGRQPQPRYGDADSGRGDCYHQILVNDAVAPQVR